MAGKSFETDLQYPGSRECKVERYVEATVKCAICNSLDVVGVCHHCGKFLCKQHIANPRIYQDPSREFVPMLEGRKWAKAIHCKEHTHFGFSALKIIALPGVIVAAFGFIRMVSITMFVANLLANDLYRSIWTSWLVSTWLSADRDLIWDLLAPKVGSLLISTVLFAIGLGAIGYGLFLHFKKYLSQTENVELGVIPVLPSQYVIQMEETVEVEIGVAATENYIRPVRHEGSISVSVTLDQSAQRSLEESRKKASKYGWQQPKLFDFGYLAIDQLRWVQTTGQPVGKGLVGNLFPILRDDIDVLDLVDKRNWQEVFLVRYIIKNQALRFPKEANLPGRFVVWLKPMLSPMSAGREVSFVFDLPKEIGTTATLKEFTLNLPRDAYKDPERTFPIQYTNGRTYPDKFQVQWLDWEIDKDPKRWPQVMFSKDVTEIASPMEASFEIQIDKTLSELQETLS